MQLDYKDIIIKHYALSMSGSEIARQAGGSKSGVNVYEKKAFSVKDDRFKQDSFLDEAKVFFQTK